MPLSLAGGVSSGPGLNEKPPVGGVKVSFGGLDGAFGAECPGGLSDGVACEFAAGVPGGGLSEFAGVVPPGGMLDGGVPPGG